VKSETIHQHTQRKGIKMETKVCKKCGVEYPIDEYQIRHENGKRRTDCRLCQNQYHREVYLEKVGKFKREIRHDVRESDPKKCLKCGELKPLIEFTIHNRARGYHRNLCHDCEKEMKREYCKTPQGKKTYAEWRELNQEKVVRYKEFYKNDPTHVERTKQYHKRKRLMDDYGLTLDAYNEILKEQGGCCAICESGTADMNGRKNMFHVDHDHNTGKIRGLLCHNCNVSLGLMKDSPLLLLKAAEYLNRTLGV
jgi:hypothetical protein